MKQASDFQRELEQYVRAQPGKVAASKKLGVSRQDLYRYLKGETEPRPDRKAEMLRRMGVGRSSKPILGIPSDIVTLDVESVTLIRDCMLHLVRLIDLDLQSRPVKERKGG